jgi:hypothetical protein
MDLSCSILRFYAFFPALRSSQFEAGLSRAVVFCAMKAKHLIGVLVSYFRNDSIKERGWPSIDSLRLGVCCVSKLR